MFPQPPTQLPALQFPAEPAQVKDWARCCCKKLLNQKQVKEGKQAIQELKKKNLVKSELNLHLNLNSDLNSELNLKKKLYSVTD
ncbi:MAG: hypothetical protein ACTSRU_12515 [Candidatus Hodarchaeales archaeon]